MSKSYKTWPTIDRSDDIVEKLDRIIELLEVLTTTEVRVPSVWQIGDHIDTGSITTSSSDERWMEPAFSDE